MKLNDIVEHAKGRRAKIYNRKPKNTIEPHKPQAPIGPMSEAEVTLKPLAGAQEVDVDGKAVGTATTPQAATAIADLAKKGEFTPNPAGQQPAAMEDEVGTPYFVKLTGNGPVVKSGNGFTPIVASKIWDTMTPEIEAKAHSQGFRKITLSVNGAMIPALEGGGKVIVGKTSYGTIVNSQNEEHNHHGVDAAGDVGGDATDSFLDQIKLQPEDDLGHGIREMSRMRHLAGLKEADAPATPAPTTPAPTAPVPADTDGPGYSFDSAKGFKDAISAEVGSADPELNAKLDQIIVAEADGTVDVDQTLYNILKEFNQLMPQMLEFVKDMIAKFTEISKDTEFLQASQADQQSLLQSIKDMQAMLPGLEKSVADMQTQFQQNEPMMQQNIKDRKMNTQMKGKPAPVAESADDQLLKQMLSIAGLR